MGYTYLTADLRTNAILGEVHLNGVEFDTALNGIGTFTGTLDLGDTRINNNDPISITTPAKTALYVDRDGVLLWGGVLWYRGKKKGSEPMQLDIRGEEFASYFARKRVIKHDLVFTQAEQLDIARDLIRYAAGQQLVVAQGQPIFAATGGDIGITLGSEPASGILRDRSYAASENKPVWDALSQLGLVNDGFDFRIAVQWVAGVPTRTLRLGYPRLGRPGAQTEWLFELPGNMTDYEYPEDGYQIATGETLTGTGADGMQIASSATNSALIDAGYPILEDFEGSDIVAQATLDSRAQALVNAKARPLITPVLYVRSDRDPILGYYDLGDDLRVRVTDARHPTTLDTYFRLVGIRVRPPDNGQPEDIELMTGATS